MVHDDDSYQDMGYRSRVEQLNTAPRAVIERNETWSWIPRGPIRAGVGCGSGRNFARAALTSTRRKSTGC